MDTGGLALELLLCYFMMKKHNQINFKGRGGHSWALLVYFLVAFLGGPSLALAKILVISDIDDTLKVSHILSTAGAMTSAVDESSHFVGMAELFQGLKSAHADIEFHYVSLAPQMLMDERHEAFLVGNGFPVSGLHMNPGMRQDPQLKQKIIRKLLKEKNPTQVIYFGDNGQFDVVVYDQMTKEFPRIPAVTYIREAYSGLYESEHPTLASQIGFVTSVEVALDLVSKKLLPASAYGAVEAIVYTGLQQDDGSETFGAMVFPWWQDCRDFKWRWTVTQPSARLIQIKNTIKQRCEE